jgi:hypothetical protein
VFTDGGLPGIAAPESAAFVLDDVILPGNTDEACLPPAAAGLRPARSLLVPDFSNNQLVD